MLHSEITRRTSFMWEPEPEDEWDNESNSSLEEDIMRHKEKNCKTRARQKNLLIQMGFGVRIAYGVLCANRL